MPSENPNRLDGAERPLRKDAQRSRQRVLDAATTLFADQGADVSFDDIARAAGVGVGTVYRRFPDRKALIDALFAEKAREFAALASAALEVADPWEAIVWFAEESTARQIEDRALVEVLFRARPTDEQLAELRQHMSSLLEPLVARARGAGVVREGIEPVDLGLMTYMVGRLGLTDNDHVWRRYLGLFLDSLRPSAGEPLTGPAPTEAMFEAIVLRH